MIRFVLSLAAVALMASGLYAQRPEGFGGRRGGPTRSMASPPGFLMMEALDANKDGKLSAREINNAVAALQKLDKNKDGKLSGVEIGWPPSMEGMFGAGGPPGGGGFPGFGGRGRGGPPGFGGFPGGGGGNQRSRSRPPLDEDSLPDE